MMRVQIDDVRLVFGRENRGRVGRGEQLTFPNSVKVIFACLRLTTGHRNNARPYSYGSSCGPSAAWDDLRPMLITRVTDL